MELKYILSKSCHYFDTSKKFSVESFTNGRPAASPAEKQSCHEFCLSAGKKCNRDIVDGFWPLVVLKGRCV